MKKARIQHSYVSEKTSFFITFVNVAFPQVWPYALDVLDTRVLVSFVRKGSQKLTVVAANRVKFDAQNGLTLDQPDGVRCFVNCDEADYLQFLHVPGVLPRLTRH